MWGCSIGVESYQAGRIESALTEKKRMNTVKGDVLVLADNCCKDARRVEIY